MQSLHPAPSGEADPARYPVDEQRAEAAELPESKTINLPDVPAANSTETVLAEEGSESKEVDAPPTMSIAQANERPRNQK